MSFPLPGIIRRNSLVSRLGADAQAQIAAAGIEEPAENKYRNKPVRIDGYRFASQLEGKRYGELRMLAKAGKIEALTVHPKWELGIHGEHICDYVGDFAYWIGSRQVVEDVKSPITVTPVYRLKRRLMKIIYGISIIEVTK